jgi:tripartite ATP-independent transporter DctP family solute receptor
MKGMKILAMVMLVALLAAGTVFAGGGGEKAADTQKPFEIAISHIMNDDDVWNQACIFFQETVNKNSNGRIDVKLYPNSQLGTETDAINSIMTNAGIDMTITGESMMSVVPEMALVGVPYLVTTSEKLHKAAGGAPGKKLEALLIKEANMRVMAYFERGARGLISNKPIRHPSELKGFVIRLPAVQTYVAAWESLGAKPVPMAWAEVFTSIQQKAIDGMESPMANIYASKFYEVTKYLNKTDHVLGWIYFVLNESKYQSLPADLQAVVTDAGKKAQAYEHEIFLKNEAGVEQDLIDHGMTIIKDVDKNAFMQLARAGVEKVLPDRVKPLYEEIKNIQ